MDSRPDTFAQRVRSLRRRAGLSQQALADKLGVSKPTIWQWETGRSMPRAAKIADLARELCITPQELAADDAGSAEERSEAARPGPPPHPIGDYIDEMKQRIAAFAGVDADRITISFRY